MKKSLLFIASCLMFIGTTSAQKSNAELVAQQTEAEKFINSCTFLKEENVYEYSDNGLDLYSKVFTDLTTGKKMAAIEFRTEDHTARQNVAAGFAAALSGKTATVAVPSGAPMPLGYLDMSEVSDVVTALNKILEIAESKASFSYNISYTVIGGLDIYFESGKDNGLQFRKKWYSTNVFGTSTAEYIVSEYIKTKNIPQIIKAIQEAQTAANSQLK